jgi:hypothetical protein
MLLLILLVLLVFKTLVVRLVSLGLAGLGVDSKDVALGGDISEFLTKKKGE